MKNRLRYVYAILAVPLIILLRFALTPLIGPGIPYVTLFPVSVAVALLAGMGPAILTGILGSIAMDYFFIEPLHVIELNIPGISRMAVVVLTSAFVGYVGDALRAARAKAEQQALALRDSQLDLNRAQTVARTGSWRLDVQKNELTWSDEAYRIFGVSKGMPLTYQSFLAFVHPDDRKYVDEKWNAALKGERYDIEHRIIVEGSIKWVRERAELEFDKDDTLLGGFGTVTDITQRKRMEEVLRKSRDELELRVKERTADLDETVAKLEKQVQQRIQAEEAVKAERKRFSDVLDMLPAYVVLLTPDYHVPFANRFFEGRFGKSNGKRCYEYLFNRTEPCEVCESYTALKTGSPHHWEWIGPDSRNYDIFDFPFTDADGSPLIMEMGIDITEQKRVQEALRSASLYSRGLLEASLDPLVTISPEGQITDVNKATELATGVARDELIGSDFSDYFTEPQKANEGYHRVISEGFVRDYPLTIRHASGSMMDVLYNAAVYKNEAGRVQGVFAAARDVTARKAAEEKQSVTNELLELFAKKTSRMKYLDSVVETIRSWSGCSCVGIRLLNEQGQISYASHVGFPQDFLQLENMLSIKNDVCVCIRVITEQMECPDTSLMTPRGSFCCNNSISFVNGLTEKEKLLYRGNCMRFGFTSIAVVPVRYYEKIIGAIHLADENQGRVPTEKVQFLESMAMLVGEAVHRFDMEAELRQSEERYRQLVELSPDGIGVEVDERIAFINSAGAKMLGGTDPRDFLGRSIVDFIHPDYVKRSKRQLKYLQRKRVMLPLRESRFLRLDGSAFDVEVAATPLVYRDKTAAQIVFRDITSRKAAEREILNKQEKLRSLTAELVLAEERERHSVAMALHDSLGPILAFSKRELGTLRKSVSRKDADALKNIGENIAQAINHTRNLTFDLSPPSLYTFGLEIAIAEMAERFGENQKLQITFENSDEPKPLTDHVKVLLYRSIRELLINIAKHADAKVVRVALSKANDEIKIVVADDGKGFNISSQDIKSAGSKGFGLFSVRERLTHIGGRIDIQSAGGRGTTVTLLAPLNLKKTQKEA